ncbi:unnamed protein product [Diatraea saccharalis]|uniref:Very-long-chain 3-oxoacyl-CoA synthase n=1 Tax=Diatraea saccharalis TaxID=40085 RepID=A0A9N9RF84_9NEOP|nr:unnamed protein product [Diatraea saccharalis]
MEYVKKAYNVVFYERADQRVKDWLLMTSPWPLVAIIITYLALIMHVLPKFMRNRRAVNLRPVIKWYNIVQIVANAVVTWGMIYGRYSENVSMNIPVAVGDNVTATPATFIGKNCEYGNIDHDIGMDDYLSLWLHAARLFHEARTPEDATFSLVDDYFEIAGVAGNSFLHTEKEGETGVVSTRLSSRYHPGHGLDGRQIYRGTKAVSTNGLEMPPLSFSGIGLSDRSTAIVTVVAEQLQHV